MAIIYRSIKGSPLTSDEVDGNFEFIAENKQNLLVFDSNPTDGSANPVTSDGIFNYIADSISGLNLSGTYLALDGSNSPINNIDWGGKSITSVNLINGSQIEINFTTGMITDTNGNSIDIFNRKLYSDNGNVVVNWSNENNGVGISDGDGLFAYLKTSFLSGNKDFEFPNESGTLLLEGREISINGVNNDLSLNRDWRAGLADTGVLTYAGASAASSTQINIGAVTGIIVDNETNPGTPSYTNITYAGASNVTVTTIGSGLASYVLLNSSGTIVFQNTYPTSAQRKSMIYLSKIGHPAGTITTVGNEPDYIESPIGYSRDLAKYIGFVNPDVRPSANGSNLNFNITSGTVYRASGNFVTDKTIPNEIVVAAQTPASFLYRTQTGAGGGFVSAIDPTTYDLSGTSTAIGGSSNQATNQRIFLVPGLGLIIQKGQTIYSTLTDAIAAVQSESFVIYPSLPNNAILIGVLSVTKGCTALNNTTTARFFVADKFGQVGGSTAGISTATLQSAYNNSLVPQITTTTTLGAVTFRRGSAADTDSVLTIQNGAGSDTLTVKGNGLVTGLAFVSNGTAGAGYVEYAAQSSAPSSPAGAGFRLFAGSTGSLSWMRNDGGTDVFRRTFSSALTANRTYTLIDSDLTFAGINVAQSFTAQQTFTTSAVQVAGLQILDTTYKTILDISTANTVRIGQGITNTLIANSCTINNGGNLPLTVLGTAVGGTARMVVQNNSSASASNIAGIFLQCKNGSANMASGAQFLASLTTTTAGAEDGQLDIQVIAAGSNQNILRLNKTSVTITDAVNIILNTSTGTKWATATSQKQGWYNATPVVQQTTGITGAVITANSGTAVNDASTFAGYTIGQVVAALRIYGFLA